MAESTKNSEAGLSTNGETPDENLVSIQSSLDSDFSYSELKLDSSSAGIVPALIFLDEICTKHIPEINDELKNHPYYFYPPVNDPGISRTLHDPEPIPKYEDDGQKKYVFMCQTMDHLVVKKFYKELLTDEIDLKYYGISSNWMRAMCEALDNNKTIKTLDLTDNWLNSDACFHLNQVIENNRFLTTIILNGCRIGPEGARRLAAGIQVTKKLKELNLSYNELGDEGIEALAPAMTESIIQKYNFSHNNLKILSGQTLSKALEENVVITNLDLSWNFIENKGMVPLLRTLKTNPLEYLNISWNGLFETKIEPVLSSIMKRPNLKIFDMSNNQLKGEVLINVSNWLWKAKNLQILRLGNNQLTFDDAIAILWNYQNRRVKCNTLDLGQTNVNPAFLQEIENLKNIKTRKNAIVIFGHVIGNYTIVGPDEKKLAFERAKYVAESKKKKDFGEFILRLHANLRKKKIKQDDFQKFAQKDGIILDESLVGYLCKQFANKKKQLDVAGMAEYALLLWPETKLVLKTEEDVPPPEEKPGGKNKEKDKGKDKKGKDKKKK